MPLWFIKMPNEAIKNFDAYKSGRCYSQKEKSGELNGLFRVQMFRQDDAHLLVTEDQIASEINDIMDIAGQIYGTFGLTYIAELSTRPDDFMGEIAVWDQAEADLRKILNDKYGEGNYEVNEGDGAFYNEN